VPAIAAGALGLCGAVLPLAAAPDVSRYNVVWETPSRDASGVMPIGNGDVAAGVYAIADGDLYILLAKNDAYTYQGDIFKTGRVRISLQPNPFASGKGFRQTLDLPSGSIRIAADGVALRIWADAGRPVSHVEVESPRPLTIAARPEFWERFDGCDANDRGAEAQPAAGGGPTQDVRLERNGRIVWYYAVGDRSVYADDLRYYGVEPMADRFPDPFRHNTFGNLLDSPDLALADGALTGTCRKADVRIQALTLQTPSPEEWVAAIVRQAAEPMDLARDWERHQAWWHAFWERGWIVASDRTVPAELRGVLAGETSAGGVREEADGAALVSQSYTVFRFLMACQSRGRVQAKFNGGLFTQQLRLPASEKPPRPGAVRQADGSWLTHEDDRLWGRRFTYQNQRLLYWPLLATGDADLMQPFFGYYANLLEVRQAITRAWLGHGGAYFRENIEPTGAERDCGEGGRPPKVAPGQNRGQAYYHSFYFTSGLETVAMMIDYVQYTGDAAFRDGVLIPFAREVLRFFTEHYPRVDGRLRLDPAQVLETWWIAVNPAPDVAGLRFCLDELLALGAGTPDDQARWRAFRAEVPEVPLRTVDGRPALAPAESWEKQQNAENGELYPVFPFRCFGLALGTGDLVSWTLKHRTVKDAFGCACWTQDQIHWAYAGHAAEASQGLVTRFRVASPMCRFPLYGREGPDSCPDFDHFGAGAVALQCMLVQEAGERILLLPAWPADWDVDFRLHLRQGTILSATVKDGHLVTWDIRPAARRAQVVVCPLQTVPRPPPIPANGHPLRAGADQSGQNRFQGRISRISLFRGPLTPEAILALARGDRATALSGAEVVGCWLEPQAGQVLAPATVDLGGPVSFEAWIQPGANEQGRILDKLTPGVNDGILLDTWPGLSLRAIVGPRILQVPALLKADAWQHVALVVDRGFTRVYLDGRLAGNPR